MTFLCMTALRNKTVAHTSLDKVNGRLCQERLLRSRNFATMVTCRAVKKFFSSRLIMNSRRLWNLTPKAQVLEGRGILGHFVAVEMSQAFHDIARFERFTGLNLFKNALNVIQNWETNSLQFYSTVLNFC